MNEKKEEEHQRVAFARTVVLLRTSADLSCASLAEQADIEISRLMLIEQGKVSLFIEELVRLARLFKRSPSQFVQLSERLNKSWRHNLPTPDLVVLHTTLPPEQTKLPPLAG